MKSFMVQPRSPILFRTKPPARRRWALDDRPLRGVHGLQDPPPPPPLRRFLFSGVVADQGGVDMVDPKPHRPSVIAAKRVLPVPPPPPGAAGSVVSRIPLMDQSSRASPRRQDC